MIDLEKINNAFRRKNELPVSLIPMSEKNLHPVYLSHCKILQPLTQNFLPWSTIHTINRLPKVFRALGSSYIAEVEALTGVAPSEITKYKFRLKDCQRFIESEINRGKLKKIIFFSEASMNLNKQWMTKKISQKVDFCNMVPHTYFSKNLDLRSNQLRLLLIISKAIVKGSFLFSRLFDEIIKVRADVQFIIISSEDFEIEPRHKDYVQKNIIKRMTFDQKKNFFFQSDMLINISPMDTMGTFLDSLMFNTPLITVPGQHASSYVENGISGYIVDSPVFYYSSDLGVKYHNVRQDFKTFLMQCDLNIWNQMFDEIAYIVKKIDRKKLKEITINQQQRIKKIHSVDGWLSNWKSIYTRIVNE